MTDQDKPRGNRFDKAPSRPRPAGRPDAARGDAGGRPAPEGSFGGDRPGRNRPAFGQERSEPRAIDPRFQDVGGDGRPRRSAAIDGNHGSHGNEPPRDAVVGLHAALALLQHAPQRVLDVYLWNDDPRVIARVEAAAAKAATRLHLQRPAWASADTREGSAQGVALRVTPFAYKDLDDVVPPEGAADGTLLVCLDSITDPRNLGAILRSSAFFGATAVILPQDRSAEVTPLVERISEGGSAVTPVVQVVNLARTLQQLQDRGVEVVGTALDHVSKDVRDHQFGRATALVFGSEGDGMRPLVRKKCDVVVHIPTAQDAVQSLNVSAFATLVLGLARSQPVQPAGGGNRGRQGR